MKKLILIIAFLLITDLCFALTIDGMNYATRKKLTIDQTKVDANLTNFPILVKLTSTNFNFAKSNADGFDIRFTSSDGVTLLKYERERHDSANSLAEYWVKVPAVSGTVDTNIYIYFRTTDTADGADPTAVLDANYVAVWHLENLTTTTVNDSTSYNNDGTKKGVDEPIETNGKIWKGQIFDGVNDYINITSVGAELPTTEPFSVEMWIKPTAEIASGQNVRFFDQDGRMELQYGTGHAGELGIRMYSTSLGECFTGYAVTLAAATWYHIIATFDGSNTNFYTNGALTAGPTASGWNKYTNNTWIGRRYDPGTVYEPYNGIEDEVRVSNAARSASWVKASYNSGNDSLLTYGPTVELAAHTYRKKITITGQAGAGTNYQVKLLVGESSGATGEQFDLESHCTNFPNDFKFTNFDGTVQLDYWIETTTGATPNQLSTVWVEVRDSLESNVDIYCYYGKFGDTDASSGVNTFPVFDDFDGASLDANLWTQYGGQATTFSGGIMTTTGNNDQTAKIVAKTASTANLIVMRSKFRVTGGTNVNARAGVSIKTNLTDRRSYNYLLFDFTNLDAIAFLNDTIAWSDPTEVSWAKNTWYVFEINHDGTNTRGRRDDGTWYTMSGANWAGRTGYPALNIGSYDEVTDFHWALVRPCLVTEPAYSSAASEETAGFYSNDIFGWVS